MKIQIHGFEDLVKSLSIKVASNLLANFFEAQTPPDYLRLGSGQTHFDYLTKSQIQVGSVS